MIEQILDPNRMGTRLKEAEKQRKGLSEEQYYMLRAKCKRDLFFLAYGILGYDRLNEKFHGDFCSKVYEIDYTGYQFSTWLYPRAAYKSTIVTIAGTIQYILPYDTKEQEHDIFDNRPVAYPANLGTDCKHCIGHETVEGSSRFLYAITAHVTGNPALLALFPEIVPDKRKHKINKYELELPRTHISPDPTIDCMGVGQRSQGRHYNSMTLDDIYGDKARDSEAETNATNQWIDNIQAFLIDITTDRIKWPGTRYKYDDTYGHIMENYGDQLYVWRRMMEENKDPKKHRLIYECKHNYVPNISNDGRYTCTKCQTYISVPKITPKSLEILKKNIKVYRSQYQNDPDLGGVGFHPEWRRFFQWKSRQHLVFALKHGGWQTRFVPELDRVILIDPGEATGGIVVTGADHQLRIFTLQAIPITFDAPVLIELLFKLVTQWSPRLVSFESDALQNVYIAWLKSEMIKRNTFFHIQPFKTLQRTKPMRIDGLSSFFAGESLFMHQSQTELIWEYDHYGKVNVEKIHILDAIAQGPGDDKQTVWVRGMPPGTIEHNQTQERYADLGRDPLTGYSAI